MVGDPADRLIRVIFRARDNGQEFPVYFTSADEIPIAAAQLQADEISRHESTRGALLAEQLEALILGAMKGGRQ